MNAYRTGIVGASSLLGKELGTALRERHFPALSPRLLGLATGKEAAEARGLLVFDDEPAVLEPLRRDQVEDLDVLFLAGTAAEAREAWTLAADSPTLLVDLASDLAAEPGAALAGLEPFSDPPAADLRLVVVAHPAAQALALLLDLLTRCGKLETVSATVFEPASERGLAGIQELEQQTVRLLALQSLPQAVYDAQIAFNVRAGLGPEARLGLDEVRERIVGQLGELRRPPEVPLALQILQAPLFHACVLSLYVRYATPLGAEAIEACLANPWLARSGNDYPDAIAAAGEDGIQLGPVRADAGGGWLFATLDNLRRTAFSAVDAAAAVLGRRSRM